MAAHTSAELEPALREVLPAEYHDRAGDLARVLAAAATRPDQPPPLTDSTLRPLLQALAGREIAVGTSLISFDGAQLGDVTFHGAVVGRDVINVALTLAPAPSALTAQERRNRQAMIQKVRAIWIDGLLAHSLADVVRIELGLTERPDAVLIPLNAQYQEIGREPRDLPVGTSPGDLLDQGGGSLLILGAPGAGKTTLLLELCRTLLARAAQDEALPIPVVFNLSSWAEHRRPMARWLVDELAARYDVPRRIGRDWVAQEQVHPLLDGLDEVALPYRDACVAAINAYRREHLGALVVCSRVADYEALREQLRLDSAALVRSLSDEQINGYFVAAGSGLAGLQTQVARDPELLDLLRTPLMLSVASIAALDPRDSSDASPTLVRDIWRRYLVATQRRRGVLKHVQIVTYLRWLVALARMLVGRSRTVFRAEDVQPDWLDAVSLQAWQHASAGALRGGILAVLPVPTALIVFAMTVFGSTVETISMSLLQSLATGICIGTILALVQWGLTQAASLLLPGFRIRGIQVFSALLQLIVFVVSVSVLPFGLLWSTLVLGLWLWGMVSPPTRQIQFADTMAWSWSQAIRGSVFALTMTALAGGLSIIAGVLPIIFSRGGFDTIREFIYGTGYGDGFAEMVRAYMSITVTLALSGGLFDGLQGTRVEPTVARNRLIHRTVVQAIASGILIAYVGVFFVMVLLFPTFGGTDFNPSTDLMTALLSTALLAIPLGILLALARGGDDVLRHLSVRWALQVGNVLPLKLTAFLDQCVDRILLRRVGAGYLFLHRLFMEYLAGLSDEEITQLGVEIGLAPNPRSRP